MIFTVGNKVVESIKFEEVKSWQLNPHRGLVLSLHDGARRRFNSSKTVQIGNLLARAVDAGLLPASLGKLEGKASPSHRVRPRTPLRDRDRADMPPANTDQRGSKYLRVSVTQKHLWRAPKEAELVIDARALRLCSNAETYEVYAIAGLGWWQVLRNSDHCELIIAHARFSGRDVSFNCSLDDGTALEIVLRAVAASVERSREPKLSKPEVSSYGIRLIYAPTQMQQQT